MIKKILLTLLLCGGLLNAQQQDWTHYVRIAGHPLSMEAIDDIIKKSVETHVYGIEVDNDPPGRYKSFLDPASKLAELKELVRRVKEIDNYAFVYIAGLECITAHADKTDQTFFKQHPDWVQRDINGLPAKFTEKDAFWIREGDEDVWISPYAPEWRRHYMEQVRQIAATGIDGIYVDIPYWMTHFDGWTETWASFDDYTVAAFKDKTGLNARTDIKLGDFDDPGFQKWLHFRIKTITEFMREIDHNIKQVNPDCKTIAEIYPGLDMEPVRVGADVYELYEVVDAIGHEYSEGAYMASDRTPYDWLRYMAGMYTFRAFAGDKASWMLSYSWDGNDEVEAAQAMQWLFLSHLMAGINTWDASGHIMSQSNDYTTREKVYKWIEEYEQHFYQPRKPVKPVGIYFSPTTRNLFPNQFYESYMGWMLFLLQSHWPFEIVTPRTLEKFAGEMLILPDVKIISNPELHAFQNLIQNKNVNFIVSGETGFYSEKRAKHDKSSLDFRDNKRILIFENDPGIEIFNDTTSVNHGLNENTNVRKLADKITSHFNWQPYVSIDLPATVSAQTARVNNRLYIYIADFSHLPIKKSENRKALKDTRVSVNSAEYSEAFVLNYLGEPQNLALQVDDGKTMVTIPGIRDGVVIWFEK